MQYGFYFDQTRCIGCNACTIACKDYNQVEPGPVRWRNQQGYEYEKDDTPVFYNLSMSCNHCAEPACKAACPFEAITKEGKGRVIIDRKKCQGAELCIEACPFAAPHVAENKQEPVKKETWMIDHPAQKCTYCFERVEDKEAPACVGACVAHALDYGDMEELKKRYMGDKNTVLMNPVDFPYAYKNEESQKIDTKPSFLLRKRNFMKVV